MKRGRIFVVAGPSGAGKDTLIDRATGEVRGIYKSVSATTRKPRENEVDGRDYYFISDEEFEEHVRNGDFLEWKDVYGKKYGTLLEEVEEHLQSGENVLLEIDVKGAIEVKSKAPDALLIFVMPPSIEELEARLRNRKTDLAGEIRTRMEVAPVEIETGKKEFDINILNDDVEEASQRLAGILRGE